MDLKNGVTKTKEFFIIRDNTTGWYVSDRFFGNGGFVHLSFSPIKEKADEFSQHSVEQDVIKSILSSPFDLKLVKVTKTLIEFDNEEEINNDKQ